MIYKAVKGGHTLQVHVLESWGNSDILGGRKLHALISLSVDTVCHVCDMIAIQ